MVQGPVPQDILKYKTKFVGNFTTREVIWGTLGVLWALAARFVFFTDGKYDAVRTPLMVVPAVICFVIGWAKLYEQPIEKVLPEIIFSNFVAPAKRLKVTEPAFFRKEHYTPQWDNGSEAKASPKRNSAPKVVPSKDYPAIK